MQKPKRIKSLMLLLRNLAEKTYVSDFKGVDKITDEEESQIRSLIAGIQNDLGLMDSIMEKVGLRPYEGICHDDDDNWN